MQIINLDNGLTRIAEEILSFSFQRRGISKSIFQGGFATREQGSRFIEQIKGGEDVVLVTVSDKNRVPWWINWRFNFLKD